MSGHSLAPLVAKLRESGDPLSIEAADAICGLVVRAEKDARWQVRAENAQRRAQEVGEVSDERLAILKQIWEEWWDDEPRGKAKRKPRLTVLLDSPWYRAIAAVGDAVEPGWQETHVFSAEESA